MAKRKGPVVVKTRDELLTSLRENVDQLMAACSSFDAGRHHFAQGIAVLLGNLLYGQPQVHRGALLQQLGMRDGRFADTAWPLARAPRIPQCCLAALQVNSDSRSASYLPMLSKVPDLKWTRFVDWWTARVVVDQMGRSYSRMLLVQDVRDQEGGHVDGELTEQFADFKAGRYLRWTLKDGEEIRPVGAPHYATIRQIAHEVLLTLRELAPTAFSSDYAFPADTLGNVPGFSVGAGQMQIPDQAQGGPYGIMLQQKGSTLQLMVGAQPHPIEPV